MERCDQRILQRLESFPPAPPKAVTATAGKLACILYPGLKYQDAYVPINQAADEAKAKKQRLERLKREAKRMDLQRVEVEKAA